MSCCGSGGCGSSDSKASETTSSGSCCSNGSAKQAPVAPAPGAAFEGSEDNPLMFTEAAVKAVKDAITKEGQPGDNLRVSVVGGGCSGYQYNLDFDREARMGDLEIGMDGFKVLVDPVSAGYLKGTVVDFIDGLNGTGFKFNNPNAKRTCGCGSSFS